MRHVAGTLAYPQDVPGNTEQVVDPTRWRRDDQERTGDGVEALGRLGMSGVLVDD